MNHKKSHTSYVVEATKMHLTSSSVKLPRLTQTQQWWNAI